MLATADEMARLRVDGIKIHLLHVLEGTPLGGSLPQGEVAVLEQAEYVELAADFLERLHRRDPDSPPDRETGPRDLLLAPLWSLNKWEVLNAIDGTRTPGEPAGECVQVKATHQADVERYRCGISPTQGETRSWSAGQRGLGRPDCAAISALGFPRKRAAARPRRGR